MIPKVERIWNSFFDVRTPKETDDMSISLLHVDLTDFNLIALMNMEDKTSQQWIHLCMENLIV